MYCIHCGKKVDGNPKFCYHCGQQLPEQDQPPPPPTPPPDESQPRRPKQKRPLPTWLKVTVIVLVVLLLLCGVLGTGTYLLLGLHRTNQASKVVPAETTLFISVCPTLSHLPQLRHVDNLVKAGAVFAPLALGLDLEYFAQESGLSEVNLDPQKDLLPWIGREVSLAVLLGDPYDDPRILLAAATRNKRASDAFLAQVRSQMEDQGAEFKETVYRRVKVTEVVSPGMPPWAYATYEHLVVVASDVEALRESIDTATGDDIPTLHDQKGFKKAVADLPASRLGYIYFDWASLPEDTLAYVVDTEELPIGSLHAIEDIVAAIRLRTDGLSFDHVTHYDISALSSLQKRKLGQAASPHKLLAVAPADSMLYVSGQNLFLTAESVQSEDWRDILMELEDISGVDLLDDLLSKMPGEYAWVAVSEPRGLLGMEDIPLGMLLFVETEDRALVEKSLKDLATVIEYEGDFRFYRDEVNDVPVWLFDDPYSGATFGYGFAGDNLFIGTSRETLNLATMAGESKLDDSELFQAATKPLPRNSKGYVYVDVQQAIRTIYRTLDDYGKEDFNDNIRPYVDSLLALSIGVEPMDKNGAARGVLFVHTAKE